MRIFITVTKEHTCSFPLHRHDTTEIMYYLNGRGILRSEAGDFPFVPGTAVLMPNGIIHGSYSEKFFTNICIHADFSPLTDPPATLCTSDNRQGELAQLFGMIRRLYFADVVQDPVLLSQLVSALRTMVEQLANRTNTVENKAVQQVKGEIEAHFTEADLRLPDLIASTGYCDDHFRLLFRTAVGLPPVQYLLKLRLRYANSLIEAYGNTLSVGELASLCGFSDPFYFSRMYKKNFHAAPRNVLQRRGIHT